ncbi:hypothetical protein SteCoe_24012 [Stentor coeruleus]|uniref:Uncharacterized protein n=1 Tax=Stentor coeruleus TaxID=5963 RepID=A0A1R2BIK1_9CILI|nr:hypothetical protein SteCoe_24012 [Stentor coeruleus]
MVEKMILVLLSLVLLTNGTNLFKPDHIFGHLCMKGLGFSIQDVSLTPWPPSSGDSSELKVSGMFEQDVFVDMSRIGLKHWAESSWLYNYQFVNTTFTSGQIESFSLNIIWPEKKGFHTVNFNLLNDSPIACWELTFYLA